MTAFAHAWWVAMMRGVAALTIALFVLMQPHTSMLMAAVALGVYVLVDGIIVVFGAVFGAIATGLGMCGALLLTEGLVGITAAMVSFSETRLDPYDVRAAQIPIVAWAFVIGIAEVWAAIRVGRELPAFQVGQRNRNQPVQSVFPPERAYLLAGIVALAFALALLALPMTSARVAIPILGLFAAGFGYLHLRGGLVLGILRLEPPWEGVTTIAAP